MIFPQDYINCPAFYLNIVQRYQDIPQNIILVYYSDKIMLIELDKQEVASVLEALLRYVYIQRVRKKLNEDSENMSSKVKNKLFEPPSSKKKAQYLGSLSPSNGHNGC